MDALLKMVNEEFSKTGYTLEGELLVKFFFHNLNLKSR